MTNEELNRMGEILADGFLAGIKKHAEEAKESAEKTIGAKSPSLISAGDEEKTMYKSPIDVIIGEMQTQLVQDHEKQILRAVQSVDVHVDKDELVKALQYDRDQFDRGYKDGIKAVFDLIGFRPCFICKYMQDCCKWVCPFRLIEETEEK